MLPVVEFAAELGVEWPPLLLLLLPDVGIALPLLFAVSMAAADESVPM